MKMLYTREGTEAALNTQRKSISETVMKKPRNKCFNPPFFQTVKANVALKLIILHITG